MPAVLVILAGLLVALLLNWTIGLIIIVIGIVLLVLGAVR